MPNYRYDWDKADVVAWSTRNMPRVLLKRLQVLATKMGHSREFVLNQALDIGLGQLEKAYPAKRRGG